MVVYVVAWEAAHRPARARPRRFLPGVLADVEVVRAAVDLDDQALPRPAQVSLLARDPHVEPRDEAGLREDLERPDLGAAPCALERQAGVAGEDERQPAGSAPAPMAAEQVADLGECGLLEPDRFSHRPRQRPVATPPRQVEQGSRWRRYRDAAEGGALAFKRRAAVGKDPTVPSRPAASRSRDGLEAAGRDQNPSAAAALAMLRKLSGVVNAAPIQLPQSSPSRRGATAYTPSSASTSRPTRRR